MIEVCDTDKVKIINKDYALRILESGKFVTVTFTKRNGSRRVLNGRSGVKKGVNGKGMAYDPKANGIVILYEMNKDGKPNENYRAVRIDSISKIRFNKKDYVVV